MTKNEAVQRMIRLCGGRPTSAADSRNEVLAGDYLDDAHDLLVQLGLPTTREDRVELTPHSSSKEITSTEWEVGLTADDDVLAISASGWVSDSTQKMTVEMRGANLWQRDDSVSTGSPWKKTFDDEITVVRVIKLPFAEHSPTIQQYMLTWAAREYWANQASPKTVDRDVRQRIHLTIETAYLRAKITAENENAEKQRANLLDTAQSLRIRGRRRQAALIY